MHNIIPNLPKVNSVKTKSFTLIELLIVMANIGISIVIAIPNYMNAILKAEIASTYARMKNTHTAIFNYMLDHQMYPPHGYGDNYHWPRGFIALTCSASI